MENNRKIKWIQKRRPITKLLPLQIIPPTSSILPPKPQKLPTVRPPSTTTLPGNT